MKNIYNFVSVNCRGQEAGLTKDFGLQCWNLSFRTLSLFLCQKLLERLVVFGMIQYKGAHRFLASLSFYILHSLETASVQKAESIELLSGRIQLGALTLGLSTSDLQEYRLRGFNLFASSRKGYWEDLVWLMLLSLFLKGYKTLVLHERI